MIVQFDGSVKATLASAIRDIIVKHDVKKHHTIEGTQCATGASFLRQTVD